MRIRKGARDTASPPDGTQRRPAAVRASVSAAMRLVPVEVLHRSVGNRALARLLSGGGPSATPTVQRVGLNSNKIVLAATGANVNRAPNNFNAARFRTRAAAIDGIDIGDVVGQAGSLAGEDVEGGIRVDLQGDFNDGGTDYQNVQAQANDPVGDLAYPIGTPQQQRGTSVAAVFVESRLAASDKADVRNRTLRLLKQGIYSSMGDRGTHPRPVYRVSY